MEEIQTTETTQTAPHGEPVHTARFRLTPSTYLQLNFIVQRRTRNRRRLTTIGLAWALTAGYGLLTAMPLGTLILLLVTEGLVVLPISSLMDRWMLRSYAQRSERISPAAQGEQVYAFYEDGFSIRTGDTESFLPYGKVESLARTDDYLGLFLNRQNAYMVLGDAADCGLSALTEFLQRKTGKPLEVYLQKKK